MALPNLSVIAQTMKDLLPKLEVSSVPTGAIMAFNDVPEGWLECNGAAVSRTTYARLFAKVGTKWGAGDGSTTFNLPNLEGRVLQGTTNLSEVGTLKEAQLPNITGSTIIQEGSNTGLLWPEAIVTGAFVKGDASKGSPAGAKGYPGNHLNLDASQCNALYSGTTNQPKAGLTLLCIKI